MNTAINTRLKAAEAKAKPSTAPIMRCRFSDNTVKDLHVLEAICDARGYDNEFRVYLPCIIEAECIANETAAPKLVEILLQIVESNRAKFEAGDTHEGQRYNPAL